MEKLTIKPKIRVWKKVEQTLNLKGVKRIVPMSRLNNSSMVNIANKSIDKMI